jgi:hypothetical protein
MRVRKIGPVLALATLSAFLAMGFIGSCSRGSSSTGGGGCARARVGGRVVCLRQGLRCEPRHERVYRSYGLTCRRAPDGYRLRERAFVGPPNP